MRMIAKRILTLVLVLSILCGGTAIFIPKQASAKTMSKVTKVLNLTSKKSVSHKLMISKNEKVRVKVKILSVTGKTSLSGEDLIWADSISSDGKGGLIAWWSKPPLKKSSFKKGKILTSDADSHLMGKAYVLWDAPKGIKKLKIRVTYYTESGKAGIKSVSKVKSIPWI